MTGAPDKPDEAALAALEANLNAREARLTAREESAAAAAQLADADTALKAHVDAGRVLPAERAPLAALLASLPADDTVIAFAAPEGEGEVQEKPRAVLERFLAGLPERVNYRELAGGRAPQPRPQGAMSDAAVAAEARALMSEAEERGDTLTAVDAVDRVRAKHGLDK